MADSKGAEHDTTPETPRSKQTIAVDTGRSDPPPGIRPAAGTPAPADSRTAKTLPRAVKAQAAPVRRSNPFAVGTAVFLLVMSVVLVLTLRGPMP